MSSELLRRAAALMRERAEAARAGRWSAEDGAQVVADWHVEPRNVALCRGSIDEGNAANATHIASWHPAVALVVADWLDASADHADATDGHCVCDDAALAVARAYLGEDE